MTAEVDWQSHLRSSIRAACVLEATARKPGNVHPEAPFEDVRFEDFVRSADVTAPVLADSRHLGVGRAIHEAVTVTRRAVGRNTNLGIILLIAPLSAVPKDTGLKEGIMGVLNDLTVEDARWCFEAIRLAHPGGLGAAKEQDVSDTPSVTLLEAMRLAADRDRIAAQFANGYREVFDFGVPMLVEQDWDNQWEQSVITLHLRLMAAFPDTLIARKCGSNLAEESAHRAQHVLDAGWPLTDGGRQEMQRFDHWLREDGHRRNPGTTADLVATTIFAGFRDQWIVPPAAE